MAILSAGANDAKEIIGKGFIDAFKILANDTTAADLTDTMHNLAEATADVTVKIAEMFNTLAHDPIIKAILSVWKWSTSLGKKFPTSRDQKTASTPVLDPKQLIADEKTRKAKALADKKALDAAARLAALTKKSAADSLALKKAGTTFDLAQIQIQAALKYGIDEDTRLRLLLQKALLDEDVAAAAKLQMALLANEAKTKELANLLATLPKADDPFADWPAIIAKINGLLKDLKIPGSATALLGLQGLTYNADTGTVTKTPTMATPIVVPTVVPTTATKPIPVVLTEPTVPSNVIPISPSTVTPTPLFTGSERDFMDTITAIEQASAAMVEYQNFRAGERGDIYVTVNTSVVGSEQALADAVQTTLQNLNRYGTSVNYAGNIAI
jgi:hypothetical protein